MEIFLAIIVFGAMGAIAAYGLMSSMRASQDIDRGRAQERPMAGVSDK